MDSFAQLGREEAIRRLYEGTPWHRDGAPFFEPKARAVVRGASLLRSEGIDFDLSYFPLKHLGHKCITEVTGELCARMAVPRTLNVEVGVSAKLDFPQVQDLWSGMTDAARSYGYAGVSLDLVPSLNGLTIAVSACGECAGLTDKRRSPLQSKDLICVSGPLGAAYLGQRLLEREKKLFADKGEGAFAGRGDGGKTTLDNYKMLVGAYLKPELNAGVVGALEDAGIYPGYGAFISRGLADAVLHLASTSGLGVKIYADKIPFEGGSFQLGQELDIDPVSAAMNGGEDCRLMYVVPILSLERFRRDFQTFDIIGHMAKAEAGACLVTPEGAELPITAQGWEGE